jgi:hypothetical protein
MAIAANKIYFLLIAMASSLNDHRTEENNDRWRAYPGRFSLSVNKTLEFGSLTLAEIDDSPKPPSQKSN